MTSCWEEVKNVEGLVNDQNRYKSKSGVKLSLLIKNHLKNIDRLTKDKIPLAAL